MREQSASKSPRPQTLTAPPNRTLFRVVPAVPESLPMLVLRGAGQRTLGPRAPDEDVSMRQLSVFLVCLGLTSLASAADGWFQNPFRSVAASGPGCVTPVG